MLIPWYNIARLVTPPRYRSGHLFCALLDAFLSHTRRQGILAQIFRDTTVQLYSNIAQPMVVERLLNLRYFDNPLYHSTLGNGRGIWITDASMGDILIAERPDYTPNHTYRRFAGCNLQDGSTQSSQRLMAYSVLRSSTSHSTSQIVHYEHDPNHPVDPIELQALIQRLVFYGLDIQVQQG